MHQQQFLEWKIKDLKKRKSTLLEETSKYAMQMAIQELEEVRDFGKSTVSTGSKEPSGDKTGRKE